MKQRYYLFVLLTSLFMACEHSDTNFEVGTEQPIVTLSVTIQNENRSRSELGLPTTVDGKTSYPVLWSEGDRLAVMQGEKLFEFTLDSTTGDGNGLFVCTSSNAVEFDRTAATEAFYPYEWVTFSNGEFCYTAPLEQSWKSGSFGLGAAPMAGYRAAGSDEALQLKNLFGVFKLQLTGSNEQIVSIELTSNLAISGAGKVLFDTDSSNHSLKLSGSGEAEKYLRLNCGTGITLQQTPTEFLLTLPATTSDEGYHLTVIITDNEGNKRIVRTNEAKIVEAGRILKMPAVCYTPQSDEYIEVQDGKKLYFGHGIQVGEQVWAPINCGYKPASATSKGHQYGRYFQWGRKYGQGYYGDGDPDEPWEDPHNVEVGPFSLKTAQSEEMSNTYISYFYGKYDGWLNEEEINNNLWTNKKTEYDPCPSGWRVASGGDMTKLSANSSDWTYHQAQRGRWFSGATSIESAGTAKVFLPACGWVDGGFEKSHSMEWCHSVANARDEWGEYWTADAGKTFLFYKDNVNFSSKQHALGLPVRCIKE